MQNKQTNRRCFLKTTATALAIPSVVPAAALAKPGRPGANDRIRVGLIGAGHRSRDLTKESPADLNLVAVADCDLAMSADYLTELRQVEKSIVSEKCSQYQDYRQMLSKEKLDGVFVATTTHARVLACLHAMQAGLDVYAEKPLTLTIEEGQYLVRAEQKFQTVFQVGTQQRSIAINNFGSDLIKNGTIGKVLTVKCPNFPGPRPRPPLPTQPVPRQMNWDLWCNQTELTPFSPELHPGLGRWARYREYCGWLVTGWVHAFDQIQRALGTDDTGPRRNLAGGIAAKRTSLDALRLWHSSETGYARRQRSSHGRNLHWRERQDRDQPQSIGQQSARVDSECSATGRQVGIR